jgi:hypothetical protein
MTKETFATSEKYPAWAVAILEALSENQWDSPSSLSSPTSLSIDTIKASFEEQVAEAQRRKGYCLVDSRNDSRYVEYCLHPNEHPWEDDVVATCRKWLEEQSTPESVWEIVQKARNAGINTLNEVLPGLIILGGSAEQHWKRIISELRVKTP